MKIKVELDLSITELHLFARWASIGRTFSCAEKVVDKFLDSNPDDIDGQLASEELLSLHNPLNNLHGQLRNQLWEIEAKLNKSFGRSFSNIQTEQRPLITEKDLEQLGK